MTACSRGLAILEAVLATLEAVLATLEAVLATPLAVALSGSRFCLCRLKGVSGLNIIPFGRAATGVDLIRGRGDSRYSICKICHCQLQLEWVEVI